MPGKFDAIYRQSIERPEFFWAAAALDLYWHKGWDKVLDDSSPPTTNWFVGAQFNTAYNCLDRHVEAGFGAQVAIIYDSPVTGVVSHITYQTLLADVALFAGALAKLGVTKGDRVIIYMPMVPQALVAMLACARLGAIHSVVFGGFAAKELASRIDDCQPKLVIGASCGIEANRIIAYKPLIDQAIDIAKHKPSKCIIFQRDQQRAELQKGRDVDWLDVIATATSHACVPILATDPLYILYTSGTTGAPKGVVRDNGGHAVALHWSMRNVYNVKRNDVFWAASDIGWVVGHSYIVYAPLLYGCTSVLYEGKPVGTPDAGAFWRVIEQHKVRLLFTAPTAFRAIKREDPQGALIKQYDISPLRALFLAGERSDPATLQWAEEKLGVPVIDHWWQTETGWAIAANCLGIEQLPVKYGSPTRPAPGWNVLVLDDEGQPSKHGEIGNIVCKVPLPPSSFVTLWNAHDRYQNKYFERFPGFYETSDAGYIDEDGYIYIMARTDDIINVAGHRLSTGGMEEVLASHPDVAECAVIGVADELKGQLPLGFLVLKIGVTTPDEQIVVEVVQLVRDRIGPVASFKNAIVVKRLPKTRSGKILRATMQKVVDGSGYNIPATIDDPAILDEIENALKSVGYANK